MVVLVRGIGGNRQYLPWLLKVVLLGMGDYYLHKIVPGYLLRIMRVILFYTSLSIASQLDVTMTQKKILCSS